MFLFLYLVLLAYAQLVSAIDRTIYGFANPQLPKNIFILAGQSNMAGRGGVINGTWDGLIPPQCQPNPLIRRFTAELTWRKAKEPLHKDIDVNKTCGVGPGMAFANSVLCRDSSLGVIGLVPCAVGGTNISEWARGTFLYNQLLWRTRAALQDGAAIRALLWYQGESDTEILEDAECYKSRLEQFFTDVRADLLSPNLPVIQVVLASGQGAYTELVRQAQLGIQLPNVRCVDAMGLQLEPDNLHLSTPAQVRLGEMLADAFLQTVLPPPLTTEKGRHHTACCGVEDGAISWSSSSLKVGKFRKQS